MQLTHDFSVPVGVEQAWEVLLDIERIAPCMPGAALETVDGDDFTGTVKVRLGPIGLTYKGKASFVTKDAASHRAVIDAQGKDARGNGTAKATITATLTGEGSGTAVHVVTDLNITGKPAQFGRGVMVDVGNKLIQQFADCLAGKLSEPDAGGVEDSASGEVADAAAGADAVADAVVGAGVTTEPGAADPDDVGPLATADLEGAEQLGTADPDSVAPDAGPSLAGTAGTPAVEPAAMSEQAPEPGHRPSGYRPPVAEVEPIDLLGSAGPALAKRLAPVAAGVLLVVLLLIRRRRH